MLKETAIESPPLNAGDRLSLAEFERRYAAHPEIKKAELIEGVVYIPSPVRHSQHSRPHHRLATWLGVYVAHHPGTDAGDNCIVRLDSETEVQPDLLLRRTDGNSTISRDDYIEGPPELIIEIAASSASYDMHIKRQIYARFGVREYLVAQMYEKRLDWFIWQAGRYRMIEPDKNGILCSQQFPGLWLSVDAFWADDLARLLKTVRRGMAATS